jgi:hypothetical protein
MALPLRDALDQIQAIQRQLAATDELRNLSWRPVLLSAALAVAAAAAQQLWLDTPADAPAHYLALWLGVALCGSLLAIAEILARTAATRTRLSEANAWLAARQFLPALAAGGLLTLFVLLRLPHLTWLLPGFWQLCFGLANLAALQLLPRGGALVGSWFLASGTLCLFAGPAALSPWAMGLPFAFGQALLAGLLWWHHERQVQP